MSTARYDRIGAGYAGTRREDPRSAPPHRGGAGRRADRRQRRRGRGLLRAARPARRGDRAQRRDGRPAPARARARDPCRRGRAPAARRRGRRGHGGADHPPLGRRPRARRARAAPRGARARRDRDLRRGGGAGGCGSWDYLPEVAELDARIFPPVEQLSPAWLGGGTRVEVVPIARDTPDWTLGSFWAHPERVLDPAARAATSGFARMPDRGRRRASSRAVERDLATAPGTRATATCATSTPTTRACASSWRTLLP